MTEREFYISIIPDVAGSYILKRYQKKDKNRLSRK